MAIDPRFYNPLQGMDFGLIASELGLDPRDHPDRIITGISSFETAGPGDLCFIESDKPLLGGGADRVYGACLVPLSLGEYVKGFPSFLAVDNPRRIFFRLASKLYAPRLERGEGLPAKVHPSAFIAPGCHISSGAVIGPRTRIGPQAVIGPGVQIGTDCEIGAGASVFFSLLGNQVRLLAGARLGETGFGLMTTPDGLEDIPHFGRVIVQDKVSIGANSCVDRGMLGDTVIGEGSKIDNLCHIGHNTQIGRHVVMAAYAGISGSVRIEDGVRMGGRVGVIDHLTIGKGAQLGAGSVVLSDVPAGVVWAGAPARPIKVWQRELVWLRRNAKKGKHK